MKKRDISHSYISRLIAKDVCGELNEEERVLLDEWLLKSPRNEGVYRQLRNGENFLSWNQREDCIDKKAAWEKIDVQLGSNSVVRTLSNRILKYAAIFVLIISLSSILFWFNYNHFDSAQSLLSKYSEPTLILENGDVIDLSKELSLNEQKLKFVNYKDQHRLVYQEFKSLLNVKHQLIVPQGKEYWIQMADSSVVHLNSESVLVFHPNNHGNKRYAKLIGEGFFNVTKNLKRPFEVNVKNQVVEVLGTSFNINAYDDSDEIVTTLVSGKVRMSHKNKMYKPLFLKPGQQAYWSGSDINILDVKTSLFTSWTEGYLIFKGERIEDIMRSLSRWYDIDVVFLSDSIKEIRFGGRLYRKDSIDTSLKLIENMNNIKIQRDGKKIIFSK